MSSKGHATTPYTDLIIAEIHHAINKLGGSPQPATPDEAQRALRGLGAIKASTLPAFPESAGPILTFC